MVIKRTKIIIAVTLFFVMSFGSLVPVHAEEDYWPYSSNTYSYTQAEFEALAKTIDAEARGESLTGKIAVGNVIMNRVFVYNSDIISIVSASGQFIYSASREPTAESYEAARNVLDYEKWVVPQNCYYFKTSPSSTWSGSASDPIKYWGKIGNHYFYVRKLDGRYNGYDVPAPMYYREYDSPRIGIIPSEEVILVQEYLIACGYELESDGYFGELTDVAVKDFQKKNNLTVDGIVGDETMAILKEAAEATGLLVKPGETAELPVEVKTLIKAVNKHKLIKDTINIPFTQIVAIFRANEIAHQLREEYNYSIDSLIFTQYERPEYLYENLLK